MTDDELRGSLSLLISSCGARLGMPNDLLRDYETATSGEAVAVACGTMLALVHSTPDEWDRAEMEDALIRRLALLGRDGDRAAKIAYPDPFAEHPA